jgi:NADPH-dependent ferric siderophore reductase
MTASRPYRFLRAAVAEIADLTPSFRRFTFRGADLAEYGDPGYDQRVKVVFPGESVGIDAMPLGDDWYPAWRALPGDERPPLRTYTTRAVRNDAREVVLDMVAHEVSGPASAWIERAAVGDEVLIYAPIREDAGVNYGVDFVPPARTGRYLLAGDETAAPAIAVILEQLPPDARGVVVVEVPREGDVAYLPRHPGFEYRVVGREEGERHRHLIDTVAEVAADLVPEGCGAEVEEVDADAGLLWEVPRAAKGGAALRSAPLYAWLAGEATGITALRRHLVTTVGIDRRAVAFMGYWRLGRSEGA